MTVVYYGIPGGCLTPDGYGKGDTKRAVMNMDDGKEKADLITLEVLPNEGLWLETYMTPMTNPFVVASINSYDTCKRIQRRRLLSLL